MEEAGEELPSLDPDDPEAGSTDSDGGMPSDLAAVPAAPGLPPPVPRAATLAHPVTTPAGRVPPGEAAPPANLPASAPKVPSLVLAVRDPVPAASTGPGPAPPEAEPARPLAPGSQPGPPLPGKSSGRPGLPPATSPAPLEDLWPELRNRRSLPPKVRVALGAAALLVLAVVGLGSRKPAPLVTSSASLDDDMIVSADDLRQRREVRPEDFQPRRERLSRAVSRPDEVPEAVPREHLEERRARREVDPEDVLTLRKARSRAAGRGARRDGDPYPATPSPGRTGARFMGEDEFAGPAYVSAGGSPSDHPDGHGIVASQDARPLAPAGLSLPVILITPLELRGGSATVIVRCEKASPLPAGTRLVGTATSSDGRVSMRFRSVLLADGRSAEIDGEAQDEDGSFGLRAGVVAAEDGAGDRGGLSLGHIARDTAMDALASTLGPGIAGRAADRTVRGALGPMERQPARGPRPAVTLEAGTRLQVFLHSAIQPGR